MANTPINYVRPAMDPCRTCGYPCHYQSMVTGPAGMYCTTKCRDVHNAYIKSHLGHAPIYRQPPLFFDDIPIETDIKLNTPIVLAAKVQMPKRFNTKWGKHE